VGRRSVAAISGTHVRGVCRHVLTSPAWDFAPATRGWVEVKTGH